jgi:putative redox protein
MLENDIYHIFLFVKIYFCNLKEGVMLKTARVDWIENMKFEGHTDSGQTVMMDTGENASAASPAELILQALAGCTMMDCVIIITKSRKTITKFWVDVEADEAEEVPKVFKSIHLTYNFTGPDLNATLVERAIKLSEEKYCRVHAMLEKSVVITSSYNINNIG